MFDIVTVAKALFSVFLIIAVLRQPFLGIFIMVASIPVLDLLPPIPYATSTVSLLGGLAFVGYILQKLLKTPGISQFSWQKGHVLGALFIVWALISNPEAALITDWRDRNWIFTLLQLWVFAGLIGELVNTPQKHRILMWGFVTSATVSAIFGIQQGVIGYTVDTSARAYGLSGGINDAARYFVVAFVFTYYLKNISKKPLSQVLVLVCMAILIFGVVYTLSRTGLLLLIGVFFILLLQRTTTGFRTKMSMAFVFVLSAYVLYSDELMNIIQNILPAVQHGTDSMQTRYGLWQAGIGMWSDHIVHGVGIGRFTKELPFYGFGLLSSRGLYTGTHSLYMQLLAETGIVGSLLFLALIGVSLHHFRIAARSTDTSHSTLAQTWSVVLIVLLIGGLTKSELGNKLIWLAIGSSFYFHSRDAVAERLKWTYRSRRSRPRPRFKSTPMLYEP